ncbi:MAG: XisI protein [Anaerolineae bacterium]|nr:XisI protein [Anaerolineae bacterium]
MDRLAEIVRHEVFWYAGGGPNLKVIPFANEDEHAYAVAIMDKPTHRLPVEIMVMARLEGDTVIIEADNTNRPLVDALVAAGIPRDKIVLAYAGEPIPEGA